MYNCALGCYRFSAAFDCNWCQVRTRWRDKSLNGGTYELILFTSSFPQLLDHLIVAKGTILWEGYIGRQWGKKKKRKELIMLIHSFPSRHWILVRHWLAMASLTDTTGVWLESGDLINRGNDFFPQSWNCDPIDIIMPFFNCSTLLGCQDQILTNPTNKNRNNLVSFIATFSLLEKGATCKRMQMFIYFCYSCKSTC